MKKILCIALTLCMLVAPGLRAGSFQAVRLRVDASLGEDSLSSLRTLAEQNNWRIYRYGGYIEIDFSSGATAGALACFNQWKQGCINGTDDSASSPAMAGRIIADRFTAVFPPPSRIESSLSAYSASAVSRTLNGQIAFCNDNNISQRSHYSRAVCEISGNINSRSLSQLPTRGPPAAI